MVRYRFQKKIGYLTEEKNGHIIKVSIDTLNGGDGVPEKSTERIESEFEIRTFIQKLQYALEHGAQINFQIHRRIDDLRNEKYTNQYTVNQLFPDEDPVTALKRELRLLTVEEYMRTVKDLRFPNRSEMREFGRVYNGKDEVYIKIRVELLGAYGITTTFVMSFHFAEKPFKPEMFPYRKG